VLRSLRALARRLLGKPPSDWVGPDAALAAGLETERFEPEAPFDVVWLGPDEAGETAALAAAGHRVFRVARGGADVSLPDASSPEDELRALDALRRDHGLGATAVVAADPSWTALAQMLRERLGWAALAAPLPAAAGALAGAFPLVSVVVVTHQNRALNRACLESVLARTEWPRLEVIAVDNGSTDGTPELLSGLAARDPRATVLALPENRGYPAGCNAGLEGARGDYLVLLNNDTVVVRGWVAALVRHLSANPNLGLVGPCTNAIANAARVDAGYRRLSELPGWAAAWTSAHDGELEDIGSLAFFCVAMRRAVWERIGPLDERFGIGMFEDGDYCRRVRAAGLDIRCARDAFVHHWQMASFRRMRREEYLALYEENRRRFEDKWGQVSV
jgi:GT2 family glycosyltransferase